MVRQAHTYLAGAVSGTALIAAAVVAFVALVSLQALKDWPLAGIGGDEAAVSAGRPAPGATAAPTVGAGSTGQARGDRVRRNSNPGGTSGRGGGLTATETPGFGSPGSPTRFEAPGAAPTGPAAPGGSSAQSSPSTSSGGSKNTGSSQPGPGGNGGDSGQSQSTSGAVADTVNKTVSGADQALGGTLGDTGVTAVTEEVVSGVAGPESTVGKTVDKTVETVGGLLGGSR